MGLRWGGEKDSQSGEVGGGEWDNFEEPVFSF